MTLVREIGFCPNVSNIHACSGTELGFVWACGGDHLHGAILPAAARQEATLLARGRLIGRGNERQIRYRPCGASRVCDQTRPPYPAYRLSLSSYMQHSLSEGAEPDEWLSTALTECQLSGLKP